MREKPEIAERKRSRYPDPMADSAAGRAAAPEHISIFCLLWNNADHVALFARSLIASVRASGSGAAVCLTALINGADGEEAGAALRAEIAAAQPDQPGWNGDEHKGDGLHTRIVSVPENLGYAGGMNHLVRSRPNAGLYVFANIDVEFGIGFIGALVAERARFGDHALLVPSTSSRAGPEVGPLRWGAFLTMRPVRGSEDPLVHAATGACMMATAPTVAKRLADTDEMFWSDLFYMSEDEDLFLWAGEARIPFVHVRAASLRHFQGGSFEGRYRLQHRPPESIAIALGNHRAVLLRHRGLFRVPLVRLAIWEALTVVRLGVSLRQAGLVSYGRSLRRTVRLLRDGRSHLGSPVTAGASA